MVLKTQAFSDHFQKRHSNDSLLNEVNVPVPFEMPIEHKAKRMRVDNSGDSTIESFSSVLSSSSSTLSATKSFFWSNAQLTAQSTMKSQPKKLEGIKIKMKLKKTDHGLWSVVTA
jgi:hypothetical protein